MTSPTDGKDAAAAYSARRLAEVLKDAERFVDRAMRAVDREVEYAAPEADVLLGRTVTRRGLVSEAQVRECVESLKAAAWLPEPPTLADVLDRRGLVPKAQSEAILAEFRKYAAQINRAYAAAAVRLGFVSREAVDECLWEVGPDALSLTLPHKLSDRRLITPAQHATVMAELRHKPGDAKPSAGAQPAS
jgi:hypothetical protein